MKRLISLTIILMLVFGTHSFVRAQLSNVTYGYVGNSFDGSNDRWVQNYIDEIEVANDGTVYTASTWDEAGRTIGYYKDGVPLTPLMKEYNGAGGHNCWGWGTASQALAIDANYVYVVNCDGDVLRFNTSDHLYVDKTTVGTCVGATCTGGKLYLVKSDSTIAVYNTSSLGTIVLSFPVASVPKDIAVDGSGNMWILTSTEILKYDSAGAYTGIKITGTAGWKPVSVSISNAGRLMVCDNGSDMQVKIYDISGTPALSSTFGASIASGTPGVITPEKFWQLAGAGTDSAGNIYVAMDDHSTGIRKFTGAGALVWETYGLFFTDMATPDPDSDSSVFYSVNDKMNYNFTNHNWVAKSFTLDRINQTTDPRLSNDGTSITSSIVRRVNGNLLMFQQGMYAGEYNVYTMNGEIAIKQANIPNLGFSGYPDRDGNIWYNNNGIKEVALTGFTNGIPNFSAEQSISSIPAPFTGFNVERVIYDAATDVMWLGGYTAPATNWGLIGTTIARYPNWSTGNRTASHTLTTRLDNNNMEPKAMAVCGDYVFTTNVHDNGSVYVYNASDLTPVGYIASGNGGNSGWVDIPQGLQVFKRSTGLYMVIVEDNLHGKDWVYEWCPTGTCTAAPISVSGVTVSPASVTIAAGSTQQLTATVSPANASNKMVTWSTSDSTIATVNSSGVVTAVSTGNATITVTTQDGSKTAACAITSVLTN